ncbi:MAG TPA: hypothetical protein DEA90_00640 [Opitutae bacterium]|nr:hypothetical protein [Puniceicoccaceae bacterium]HBR92654.1 hypothetical protein [Opitutae bacterium]
MLPLIACVASTPRQYPNVERIFEGSGYVISGTFIDKYEEEIVEHRIHHDRGTERIQRSYIGEIEIEAILPRLRSLGSENYHTEKFPVRFTKADLGALKKASLFIVNDEAYGYVRPLNENNPHRQEIKDILESGRYYYRPYRAFVGLWVGEDKTGKITTMLSLENLGVGSWGTQGGHMIHWKPFHKTLNIYFAEEDYIKLPLLFKDKKVIGFEHNDIRYRRPTDEDSLETPFQRMLEQQSRLPIEPEHPALGVWKVNRSHLQKTKNFLYIALNPDSSVYWFNSDQDFIRFGSWKTIAGEKVFYFKFDDANHQLAEIIKTNSGDIMKLNYFSGKRLSRDELAQISLPQN